MVKNILGEKKRTLNNIRNYWKDNILAWEKSRYSIGSYLNPFSFPTKKRLQIGSRWVVENHQPQDCWLELGCGSGRLLQALEKSVKISYVGLDIAESALLLAREKFSSSEFEFLNADILEFRSSKKFNGLIALGVVDWVPLSHLMQNPTYFGINKIIISFNQKNEDFVYNYYHKYFRKISQETGYPIRYTQKEVVDIMNSKSFKLQKITGHGLGSGKICYFINENHS